MNIICGRYSRTDDDYVDVSLKEDGMYLFDWSVVSPSYKSPSEAELTTITLAANKYKLDETSIMKRILKSYEC